jgi:hypothetical protein
MNTRRGLTLALATLLACGGTDAPRNAAEGRTFQYGAPATATATETSALHGALATAFDARTAPQTGDLQALADFSEVTATLLGDEGLGMAPAAFLRDGAPATALTLRGVARTLAGDPAFSDPACVVVTPTSVTLNRCAGTVTDASGTVTVHANGSLNVSGDTLGYDLTLNVDATQVDAQAGNITASASFHQAGTVTVKATTVTGHMARELAAQVSAQGQRVSFNVSETLDVNVTYDAAQGCVTGGTLEAKRVWVERPTGASAAQLPDRGALVTWTGCDTGTVAFSR